MPVPLPQAGEVEADFISRCVNEMIDETKDNEQAVAICKTAWSNEMETDIADVVEDTGDIKPIQEVQEILAFPKGEFFIEKLNQKLTFDKQFFSQVINNFENDNFSKPFIDKNHELKESFGDVEGFTLTDEGLAAQIRLNDLGVTAIKDREYRYISPTFGTLTDNTGKQHKNVLISISLTNIPALQSSMPQLQDQLSLENEINLQEGKTNMKQLSKKIVELQNQLSIDSKIVTLEDGMDEAGAMEVLGMVAAAVSEIQEMLASVTQEKEVAEEVAAEATAELETIKKAEAEKAKADFFTAKTKSGQIQPAELEAWKDHYDKNPEFVIKMLEMRKPDDTVQLSANLPDSVIKLEKFDEWQMKKAGLDPLNSDDVNKYKEWTKE